MNTSIVTNTKRIVTFNEDNTIQSVEEYIHRIFNNHQIKDDGVFIQGDLKLNQSVYEPLRLNDHCNKDLSSAQQYILKRFYAKKRRGDEMVHIRHRVMEVMNDYKTKNLLTKDNRDIIIAVIAKAINQPIISAKMYFYSYKKMFGGYQQ